MNILLVDDEFNARESLHILLENYCPGPDQYFFAEDVRQALGVLADESIDVVFLDIEMPIHKGFELFNFIPNPSFSVVFVTAYDHYAIKAFEVAALDYILKPVEAQHLIRAYHKARDKNSQEQIQERLAILYQGIHQTPRNERIAIPIAFGYEFIEASDIVCVKANGAYSEIMLERGNPLHLSKRLNQVFEILPPSVFYRVNRSYIVNVNKIKSLSKKDGGFLQLTNQVEILLSKKVREALIDKLS
ncbi:MAG: LytTR family DNA-binding domain-containing protein [Bacteroidota bacterium]